VRDELGEEAADVFEGHIIDIFERRRIESILGLALAMDRANALYAKKLPAASKYGMHWYCEYHFSGISRHCRYDYSKDLTKEEREKWDNLVDPDVYPGDPPMNKRLYQLLFSDKLGLRRRHPDTLGRWSKPQVAEFAETTSLAVSSEHEGHVHIERQQLDELSSLSSVLSMAGTYGTGKSSEKSAPPSGYATLVYTDVEESTALGQALENVYDKARKQHDDIMRRCIKQFKGYVIATEGDAFQVAFHDAVDAVEFAMAAQEELYEASWSNALLANPNASHDKRGKFKGLRVRMSIHSGSVVSSLNALDHRVEYSGKTCSIIEEVEKVSHGGQIVVTESTWNDYSKLGQWSSPQLVDLGKYGGGISMRLLQVLPTSLSFDYQKHCEINSPGGIWNFFWGVTIKGRQFPVKRTSVQDPPPPQLLPGFYDAPKTDGMQVTICFLSLDMKKGEDKDKVMRKLAEAIQNKFLEAKVWKGYLCKAKMLAFGKLSDAVRFGLDLQASLQSGAIDITKCKSPKDGKSLLKVGICNGKFESMYPDPLTGRADYFGTVVNCAARVAATAKPGDVYVGIMTSQPPMLERGLSAGLVEKNTPLKGLKNGVDLYKCSEVDL
jgi:class 3 adenylate cyclase